MLDGRVERPVDDAAALDALLAAGDARKRRAATAMNERSTRAHTLLLLRFRQRRHHMAEPKTSLLVLADLGGSEKLTKSRANAELRTVGAVDAGEDEEARENARKRARARARA